MTNSRYSVITSPLAKKYLNQDAQMNPVFFQSWKKLVSRKMRPDKQLVEHKIDYEQSRSLVCNQCKFTLQNQPI